MRTAYPPDITIPAERAAYRRGWQDRAKAGAAVGGRVGGLASTPAKVAAAKANGAKGGRPRNDAVPRRVG